VFVFGLANQNKLVKRKKTQQKINDKIDLKIQQKKYA
jgi:hypothetical protein